MSHVAHRNESCRTQKRVMLHTGTSHVAHRNESCRTQKRVTSHIEMSHVAHRNKSCHIRKWVTSHTEMRRDTHRNESCRTQKRFMSYTQISYVTHRNASWRTWKRVMTRFTSHDSLHIETSHVTLERWNTYANELHHTQKCIMTRIETSHVAHTNKSCHAWGLKEVCGDHSIRIVLSRNTRTHKRVTRHVSHRTASCHKYGWAMSHIEMSHYDCHQKKMNYVTHAQRSHERGGMSPIEMWHVTHTNKPCRT